MDISEIINRPRDKALYTEEMCFVIQQYLFQLKGVRVSPMIDLFKGIERETKLMIHMYGFAELYFKEQNKTT